MGDLRFWIPALWFPIAAITANVIVRRSFNLSQSALPDLILCFVVFDALVVIQNEEFSKFIQLHAAKEASVAVYGLLLFVNSIVWFLAVSRLEVALLASHQRRQSRLNLQGMGLLLVSMILATMVVFTSVAPFAYGGH